jgi:glycosyltransferase involved in cell wall biosynthesis
MTNKKLSIIIPVYNTERYIGKCISSILDKLDNNLEIEVLIINDGSNDNTPDILKNIKNKYDCVKIINKKNTGVSDTRNVGIEQSSGKYIMFVDADDEMNDGWYSNIEQYLNKDNDFVFFQKGAKYFDKEIILKNILKYEDNLWSFANPWSKLYKSSMIKENDIKFNKEIINGEDMLFNIEVLNTAHKYEIVDTSIYKYRINEGQSTKKFKEEIINSDIKFQKELEFKLEKYNIDENTKKSIINFNKIGGIYLILKRLCTYENLKYLKEKSVLLENECYKDIELASGTRKEKIVDLLYKKRYTEIYIYFKLISLINKLKVHKEFFIEV